jgi:hypothetical protein
MFRRRLHNGERSTLQSFALACAVAGAGLAFSAGPGVRDANAADPSSDIPGVELPGPIAAGRLGGAIYDVVYRMTVAPGYVIVASLTGTAGTDFDLYLFDGSATTVQSNSGLLTKSIGPTSTESISWPSRGGGTYFIDLNGSTDLEGDYRLTVQAVPDPTPPVVSMTLAGGRISTNQFTVPITLTASDDLSGVTEMAFGTDGSTYADWQPFAPTATWTFGAGDGPKTLWVKVKNGVGLDSLPSTARIAIDTRQPSAVAIAPAPGSSVAGLRPRFSVVFDEPMAPATWLDLGLIIQSAKGDLVVGKSSYDPASRTGTFTPAAELMPGGIYIVTIGHVEDIAGNPVTSLASWTIVPLSPTDLKADPSSRAVVLGGSVQVGLSLLGAPAPANLQVAASLGSTNAFTSMTTLNLVNGQGSMVVSPTINTTYRFSYAGAFGVSPNSVDVRVLVRRSVTFVARASSAVSRARVDQSFTLTAAIAPAVRGPSVSFRLYRFDSLHRTWVYAGSHGRKPDAEGRATLLWTPTKTGMYYWRAYVASTNEYANNVSAVYRWAILR